MRCEAPAEVIRLIESSFPLEDWPLNQAATLPLLPPDLQPKVFALIKKRVPPDSAYSLIEGQTQGIVVAMARLV